MRKHIRKRFLCRKAVIMRKLLMHLLRWVVTMTL